MKDALGDKNHNKNSILTNRPLHVKNENKTTLQVENPVEVEILNKDVIVNLNMFDHYDSLSTTPIDSNVRPSSTLNIKDIIPEQSKHEKEEFDQNV